tara:strand:- start:103 stop:348 length:246 start_codon:yes stop_codon:yes gene_type:complete
MSIDYIVELIEEEEAMAATINTGSPDFEGSDDQRCFRLHQENIIKLKKCFNKYTKMQTALRNIRSVAPTSIGDIAQIALTA